MPVLNEKLDTAEAVMGDILVAQHRLLSDVLSLESLLQGAESEV
jgi:hypothetical protein